MASALNNPIYKINNEKRSKQEIVDLLNSDLSAAEKAKINTLERICFNEGLEPVFFNLSEYMKSGAMLSCMMMHLNYVDQTKSLL